MDASPSASKVEVEIKIRIAGWDTFEASLPAFGFRVVTHRTLERNVLFDTDAGTLRSRQQLLRIRNYGKHCKLTHKAPATGEATRHKRRVETEIEIEDGEAMAQVLGALGYKPVFIYEKWRSEWTDGEGQLVVDQTPIGDFAELEGAPEWIDASAVRLGVQPSQYITSNYANLFFEWKRGTGSSARNMTFDEIGANERS